jgi:hypothetical protein
MVLCPLSAPVDGRLADSESGSTCTMHNEAEVVVHLFSNDVSQEQDNTIVNCKRPSSSKALFPRGYSTHQTKV